MRPFYIVDVFAEQKYEGNQLAVVRHAEGLTSEEMLQIAREMNYSETTFIADDDEHDGGYNVRIFTPGGELPFAGHPTLGSAYVIQREIIGKPIERLNLNMKIGAIPVSFQYENGAVSEVWMRQNPPTFKDLSMAEQVANILSISPDELDAHYPIQESSTGTGAIIVPIKTLATVQNIQLDTAKYFELVNQLDSKLLLVFCPQTLHPENDLHVRVFAGAYNIPEDPATGSANGCLCGYLVKHRYYDQDEFNLRVEQGYEINRPSLLRLQGIQHTDHIEVNVGGNVIPIARGELE